MKREKFLPVDLGHIHDKILAVRHAFEVYNDSERSQELRDYYIKQAESITNSLSSDIDYYMDTRIMGDLIPFGLRENN